MLAIVVTLDRLTTRLTGCYGNEWIETPHLDRLASQGVVFDRAFADHVGDRSGLGWVTGAHAWRNSVPQVAALESAGIRTHLVVSESAIARPRLESGFRATQVTGGQDGLAAAPDSVPWARLIQAGLATVQQADATTPRLVWLHGPEPGLPPEGFATLYFEDFAERGVDLAERPPETWDGEPAVMAGSVSLWDHWLGELMTALDRRNEPTLLLVTAGAGQNTQAAYRQESGTRPGLPAEILSDDLVRTPCLLSVRGTSGRADLAGTRCPHLVQPMDVLATVADWFGVSVPGLSGFSLLQAALQNHSSRCCVGFGDGAGTNGLQTDSWKCLVRTPSDAVPDADARYGDEDWPEVVQLFTRPDDTWDVTDLATQFPETCEELVHELNRLRRDCRG